MSTLRFKTTINCGNCVRSVKAFLEDVPGLEDWAVDIDDPNKVLTVMGDANADMVVEAVEEAGFEISILQ